MDIIDFAQENLKKIDGYGEIRIENSRNLGIALLNGKPREVRWTNPAGGSVRVLLPGHGWGFAVFNKIEDLPRAVQDAMDASRLIIPDEPIKLAEIEPVQVKLEQEIADDASNHSLQEKYELLLRYDGLAAGIDDRIIQRILGYSEEYIEQYLFTTEGTQIIRVRTDEVLRAVFRARSGNIVQSAHKSYAARGNFAELTKLDDMVTHTAKIAAQLLDAKPVKGGKYTVVLNPGLAGVFIHEAFGHLSEADHIEDNPQAREMMTLGRRFGPEFLNVIDDGSVKPDIRGTIDYDDEGVPAQKTYLIKEGVLVGRLHSRETAGKMGEKPTGNARAQDFSFPPIVRMTNTAIEAGPHPADQIFDGIKEGVYAIDAYGGQTELENFSFSAGYGYMIRDGKVAELVRDVVLQGNLFQTLANIEQIGDDFQWDRAGGYCGKGGQRAKTSEGSPHIRIRDVIIAGV